MSEFLDTISQQEITSFCQKWQIREFALFGSVVGDDFKPESDIDVLVSFTEKANWGLFDHAQMRLDLEAIFNRKVDLVTRRALEQSQNEILRERILNTAKTIYSDNEVVYAEG
jgi:predicted nucleotidyltransferase